MQSMKPVIFTIGNERYGIDINLIKGIEKQQKVTPIPNGPGFIKGIMNLRGEILPVYSLRKKFNFAEQYQAESNLIITKAKDLLLAIEVDQVKEIHEIEGDMIRNVPKIVYNEETQYLKCIAKVQDELVLVIEPDKLLSDQEKDDVKDFMENQ